MDCGCSYSNAGADEIQTSYECACVLRDTIKPYILRRLKEDVLSQLTLPQRSEQVLFCKLTAAQLQKYEAFLVSAVRLAGCACVLWLIGCTGHGQGVAR